MNKEIQLSCEIAVIGAGPAGIAAATVAAEAGKSVVLVDENANSGGQIWRGEDTNSKHTSAGEWLQRLENTAAQRLFRARVFHANCHRLFAESPEYVLHLSFEKLILATGARERFLGFPGWTLPGVMGAGGLQALIKSGLPVSGKRIVIAGTGPLLLAVAAFAREKGADIVCIAEQTSWARFARFGLSALWSAQKSTAALSLLWQLRGIPHWKCAWPIAAIGDKAIRAVRILRHGQATEIPCDYLACGFHLVPSLELAASYGCRLHEGFVDVDENQQTSLSDIYCAGEMTGIGGFERSLLQGQIAGYSAAGLPDSSRALRRRRAVAERHVRRMRKAFQLRDELKSILECDTLVCRCEDVSFGKLREFRSWREAKLQTRCGMGPCQGRVCGPATEFLFGWEVDSARPPIFPVECSSLASISPGHVPEHVSHGGSQ
jgi:NADPH-dependent 2,4-dienoyl-CoA reductase/sulfur reductase-like enzyme